MSRTTRWVRGGLAAATVLAMTTGCVPAPGGDDGGSNTSAPTVEPSATAPPTGPVPGPEHDAPMMWELITEVEDIPAFEGGPRFVISQTSIPLADPEVAIGPQDCRSLLDERLVGYRAGSAVAIEATPQDSDLVTEIVRHGDSSAAADYFALFGDLAEHCSPLEETPTEGDARTMTFTEADLEGDAEAIALIREEAASESAWVIALADDTVILSSAPGADDDALARAARLNAHVRECIGTSACITPR